MTKNLDVKVFSLVFAIILWIFATTGKKGEIGIIVPVEIKNVPKSLVVVDFNPTSVDVRISGPKSMLRSILDRELRLPISAASFTRKGVYRYRVTGLEMNLPRGVVVKGIDPRFVEIELDRLVKKEVPVVPMVLGEPAKFYRVSSVDVNPVRIVVEGPERYVSKIKKLETESVSISGRSESFTSAVGIKEPGFPHISLSQDRVEVSVSIEPVVGKKILYVPVELPEGVHARLKPSKVKVVLEGPLFLLRDLDPSAVKAVAPLDTRKTSGYTRVEVHVKMGLKGHLEVKKVSPERIRYRVLR